MSDESRTKIKSNHYKSCRSPKKTASQSPSKRAKTSKLSDTKAPIVKFSPFEALSIGQNNKVLQRHSVKNTIFVPNMRRESNELDPKELFGIPNPVIKRRGRPPTQRVTDARKEVKKPSRGKYRRELCLRETVEERIVRKLNGRKTLRSLRTCKVVLQDFRKEPSPPATTLLYKNSPKQDFIVKYLNHLYVSRAKQPISTGLRGRLDLDKSYTLGPPTKKDLQPFDVSLSENLLDEISKKFYEGRMQEFRFPEVPNRLGMVNFDDDTDLQEILYQFHPKPPIRFATNKRFDDFSDALKDAKLIERGMNVIKKYSRSSLKNTCTNAKVGVVVKSRVVAKMSRNSTMLYEKRLICGTSLGTLLLRDTKGRETFLGNLISPVSCGP